MIKSVSPLYLKSCRGCGFSKLAGLRCVGFLRELIVEVQLRRACEFTCVVLAGTSEGVAGPKVLEGARCRCCGRIDFSENLSWW